MGSISKVRVKIISLKLVLGPSDIMIDDLQLLLLGISEAKDGLPGQKQVGLESVCPRK